MRLLYTILYIYLLPVLVLRLYWRGRKAPAYKKRIKERFALIPKRHSDKKLLWVHAVSVGETIAATPMIKRLQAQHLDLEICITTTTPTGSERVRAAFGKTVLHYYLPYDVPSIMMHFIRQLQPSVLVIMETELWPNLIAVCADKHIPVVLANARMSERSARGYARFAGLSRTMLQSLPAIAVQAEEDAKRLIALGARDGEVFTTGSIKYDVSLDQHVLDRHQQLAQMLQIQDRRCCVFASTHPGEDELIVPMVKRLSQLDPSFLAIIVPRHPERFDVVEKLCLSHRLSIAKLSQELAVGRGNQVLLVDTMGDMLAVYGLAQIAFVGGSLIKQGGHNFLEAAAWSLPILTGKSVFNFKAIAEKLHQANAITVVPDHYALERELQYWLSDPEKYRLKGLAANKVLLENQGALDRLLRIVNQYLFPTVD